MQGIVVNRDVFSTNWNWNADRTDSSKEDFVVTLAEFGNHCITTESEQLRIKQATDTSNVQSAKGDDSAHDDDEAEIIEPELQCPRRSDRVRVKPKYLMIIYYWPKSLERRY